MVLKLVVVLSRFLARLGFPWYYANRALGVGLLMYGLLVDQSDERGTIILGGLGLLGLEPVVRSEDKKKEHGTR